MFGAAWALGRAPSARLRDGTALLEERAPAPEGGGRARARAIDVGSRVVALVLRRRGRWRTFVRGDDHDSRGHTPEIGPHDRAAPRNPTAASV
jgi:hypothetical protein